MDFLACGYTFFLAFWSVFHAFFLVDSHNTSYFGNRIGRALFDAGLIMDTTDFADRFGDLGTVRGAAPDDDPVSLGNQLDDPFGAGADATATCHTLVRIDHRKIVHHGDRPKRARLSTFAKANTTVLASRWASKCYACTGTCPEADIIILLVHVSLNPGTAHNSNHFLYSPCSLSRDLSHGIGNILFAGKAKVWWNVGIVDNLFCVCFTPGEAAATSLGSRKGMQHLFHLGIRLYMEFLGGYSQPDSEKEPDASQCGYAT
jgi:hypothetical protein